MYGLLLRLQSCPVMTDMTHDDKLADIKTNPDKHRHGFLGLCTCCTIDGAISAELMDAHQGLLGYNGGTYCDVLEGPCACGAWHHRGEKRYDREGRQIHLP